MAKYLHVLKTRTLFSYFLCTVLLVLPSFAFSKPTPAIHVFGDSHSMEFKPVPKCIIHWLGPITMHRVGRDELNFLNLLKIGITENQIAIFSFGEIDVRCHIGKQRDQFKRELNEVIETLVIKYIHTILQNKALYKNLTCIIYSVTPPTNSAYNYLFPYYGTLQDRIIISKLLNQRLAEVCKQVGIHFLDVYDNYANKEGSLIPAYSDGGVHINQLSSQFITLKLKKLLIGLGYQYP